MIGTLCYLCLRVGPNKSGAPGGTRTPDPLLRRQTLYPTELRARGDKYNHGNGFLALAAHIPARLASQVRKQRSHASNCHLRLQRVQLIIDPAVFQGYREQPDYLHRAESVSPSRVRRAQANQRVIASVYDRRQRNDQYHRAPRKILVQLLALSARDNRA